MSLRIAWIVVVASLAAPAVASAAPPWSPPQALSAPHLFVDAPGLAIGAGGEALATWGTADGVEGASRAGTYAASRPVGATAFGRERVIASPRTYAQRPTQVTAPVAYGASRVLAVTQRAEPATGTEAGLGIVRLAARFGDTSGNLGTPVTLAVRAHVADVRLAADAAGDAAVVWFENRGVRDDRVYVALRRRGGRFGVPLLVATDRVRSASVAVSPRGDVLVAWDARGTVRTRLRLAGRRSFAATDTIASAPTFFATLRTAVTGHGRAYVAWTAQLLTEGGTVGPFYAEAAVRPAGARRFRSAQLLERATRTGQNGVDLVVEGEAASLAWSGLDGNVRRVRVATTDAAARFGAVQAVSPPGVDAVQPTLAAGSAIRVLAWIQGGLEGEGQVVAAAAAATGPFGTPEAVSSGLAARVPDAAVSPSGVPAVVWSERPSGSGSSPPRTFAQVASRTG